MLNTFQIRKLAARRRQALQLFNSCIAVGKIDSPTFLQKTQCLIDFWFSQVWSMCYVGHWTAKVSIQTWSTSKLKALTFALNHIQQYILNYQHFITLSALWNRRGFYLSWFPLWRPSIVSCNLWAFRTILSVNGIFCTLPILTSPNVVRISLQLSSHLKAKI